MQSKESNRRDNVLDSRQTELANLWIWKTSFTGEHLARTIIWILVANTLVLFGVDRHKNEKGEEVPPKERFLPGFIQYVP